MKLDTVMEFNFGLMVLVMKVNGDTIKQMVMVLSGMCMETDMMAIGSMIKHRVKGYILTPMEQNTKANGLMIFNMDMALKTGLKEVLTKAIIIKVKNTEKEVINGQMVVVIMEIG